MEPKPKEAAPVRPRFRPEDYLAGNVPSVDSEEYKKILAEEEEQRRKVQEESRRRQTREIDESFSESITEVVSKLNLALPEPKPRAKRLGSQRSSRTRSTMSEEGEPSKKKRPVRKLLHLKEETDDDFESDESNESLKLENDSEEESEDVDNDEEVDDEEDSEEVSEEDDEDFSSEDEGTPKKRRGRTIYRVDERFLEYIVRQREELEEADKRREQELQEAPAQSVDEEIPPQDLSFGIETLKKGDVIYVDKEEENEDRYKKATVLVAFHEYSARKQYYEGQLVILDEPAKQSSFSLLVPN